MSLKTKIVCTLGPASRDPDVMKGMIEAGMDVARINTGHAEIEEVVRDIHAIARVGQDAGKRVGIMLDLQGPRLRVGPIKGSETELKTGQRFTITTEPVQGDSRRVSVSHPGLAGDLKPGDAVLIDDGLIKLRVISITGTEIGCEVLEGGPLKEEKGMNFPGTTLGLPSFTERDRDCLEVGLETGVDWIAQSFVRSADDIGELRSAIKGFGHHTPIMAKIERADAVRNIDSIIQAADGVMVARGDLGVEMETEEVPLVQKELIRKALRSVKPVLTATQMLESMVERPRPTRAEASDVANAILDGTDALVLCAETAIGAYPEKVVETMARIAERTERALDYRRLLEERGGWVNSGAADAIGYAACKMAEDLDAKAIVTVTRSGYTARLIARYRPRAQILAACQDREVVDWMSVLWGVRGLVIPLSESLRETIDRVVEECERKGYLKRGDLTIITGGFLDEKVGTTNTIHVHEVD